MGWGGGAQPGLTPAPMPPQEPELEELRAGAKPVEAGNMESMLHDKIYRDTLYHPKILPIVEQLCGENYRLDHLNVHTHVAAGFQGGGLHGGHHPGGGSGFYQLLNGQQFLNGLISVTYELYDTHCNGGGFCCIPGVRSTPLPRPPPPSPCLLHMRGGFCAEPPHHRSPSPCLLRMRGGVCAEPQGRHAAAGQLARPLAGRRRHCPPRAGRCGRLYGALSIIERRPALFFLGHILPVFARVFAVFSRFSPS